MERGSCSAAKVKVKGALAALEGDLLDLGPAGGADDQGHLEQERRAGLGLLQGPREFEAGGCLLHPSCPETARVAAPGRVIQSSKKRLRSLPDTASATFWMSRKVARFSRNSR
jgi:hypothetical protein